MWLLLFGLTALVLVLPMLPAIAEWRRPSDIAPLHIDAQDALDPTWPARSAADRMIAAIAAGHARCDDRLLAYAPPAAAWPLDDAERRAGRTRRAWHTAGDAVLPENTRFSATVFARGNLATCAGNVYSALWARHALRIAEGSTVLRWAHAFSVVAANDCRLAGRITADGSIAIASGCRFVLLDAPVIKFAGDGPPAAAAVSKRTPGHDGLPSAVRQDAASGRGVCTSSLDLGADRGWYGDLVCHGDLAIGVDCTSTGSVKARGAIDVGARCVIDGAVVAEGAITLGDGAVVLGSVVSETAIVLSAGSRVGSPGRPSTVSAPHIEIADGVVVHGTVWAGASGKVAGARPRAESFAAVEAVAAPEVTISTEALAA